MAEPYYFIPVAEYNFLEERCRKKSPPPSPAIPTPSENFESHVEENKTETKRKIQPKILKQQQMLNSLEKTFDNDTLSKFDNLDELVALAVSKSNKKIKNEHAFFKLVLNNNLTKNFVTNPYKIDEYFPIAWYKL